MNRTILLSMTESDALANCAAKKVDVSVIERLHDGGVRLVCSSSAGAETMRKTLKSKLISGDVTRQRIRPRHSTW